MSDPRLGDAAQLLAKRSGVAISTHREPLLRAELERLGQGSLDRGLAVLRGADSTMIEALVTAFVAAESYLFRCPDQFRTLRGLARDAAAQGRAFQVLCAGVSTGEEAWSAAMVIAEIYEAAGLPFHVLGWDLSRARLDRARLGRFSAWSAREGVMGYERYLVAAERGHVIVPRLRRRVSFERVNLVEALPELGRRFDVIFFRNVAMYWDARRASMVAARLADLLGADGALFVGPSDPIELDASQWQVEHMGLSIAYRRRAELSVVTARRSSVRRSPPSAGRERGRTRMRRRVTSPAASGADARAESWLERARALAGRGAHDQALRELAEQGSSCAEVHELEGIIHLDRGRHEQAIESFRLAMYWDSSVPAYARWLELARASRARAQQRCASSQE